MRSAKEKRQRWRRQRKLERLLADSAMIVPAMFMWLGLVYMFVLELTA